MHTTRTLAALALVGLTLASCGRDPDTITRAPSAGEAMPAPADVALTPAPRPLLTGIGARDATPLAHAPAVAAQPADPFLAWCARAQAGHADPAVGLALAKARRAEMQALIRNDPEAALARAVPWPVRAALPAAIAAELETPVAGMAQLGTVAWVDAERQVAGTERTAAFSDRTYRAYTYGRRTDQGTARPVAVHGVAIGGDLAVHEMPARLLAPGEPRIGQVVGGACPVSGDPAEPDIAAVLGDQVRLLCAEGHIHSLNTAAIADEAQVAFSTGPGGRATGETEVERGWSSGRKRFLYIRARFRDQPGDPCTVDQAQTMFNDAEAALQYWSFGAFQGFDETIMPVTVVLPKTLAEYDTGNDYYSVRSDAIAIAKTLGYAADSYDFHAVRYAGGPGSFGGAAYVGLTGMWMKTNDSGTFAHEVGHNLGLPHANYWGPDTGDPLGPGTNTEYGNRYDTMGSSNAESRRTFGACFKHLLRWLPGSSVAEVHDDAVVTLYPVDHNLILGPTMPQGLRLPGMRDLGDFLAPSWLEYRSIWSDEQDLGVLLTTGDCLIDTTPRSRQGKDDAFIRIGRTFSDPARDLHITPLRVNSTTPQSIDVQVRTGPFPGNDPPIASLTASTTTPAANATVTFTCTASDPDGDTLAYSWDFGADAFGGNAATASRSFANGVYRVLCTVSDMRGRTATASVLLTVGSGGGAISGTVRDQDGQPLSGVLVWNGDTNTSRWRGGRSDSAGAFTVSNTSGNVSLVPLLAGYVVPAATTVASGTTNAQFTLTALPRVALTVVDGLAIEGTANTALIRLSRTGPTTNALDVRVRQLGVYPSPAGTANVDATWNAPATASGFTTLTLPAGAASLDLTITALADSSDEGVEVVLPMLSMPDDDSTPDWYPVYPAVARVDIGNEAGPANDNLANATVLSGAAISLTSQIARSATREANEPLHFHNITTDVNRQSVWYRWTAPADGVVTINAGTGGHTAIYRGSAYGALTLVGSYKSLSPLAAPVTAGTVYSIVYASNSSYGVYNFSLNFLPTATLPTLSWTTATAGTSEGNVALGLAVLASARTTDTAVTLTVGGTLSASERATIATSFVIPAGMTTYAVAVAPNADGVVEPNETVVLTLQAGPGYTLGANPTYTVTVIDSTRPVASIAAISNPIESGPTAGIARVSVTPTTTVNRTVYFSVGGTATAGTDYTALGGSVVVPANQPYIDVSVTPVADGVGDAGETVVITLSDIGNNYQVAPGSVATLTIVESGAALPVVTVAATDASAAEAGTDTGRFTITRTPASGSLTIQAALSGTASSSDYAAITLPITMTGSTATAEVVVTPVNDTAAEAVETVVLTITPSAAYTVGAASSATVTITSDDVVERLIRLTRPTGTAWSVLQPTGANVQQNGDATEIRVLPTQAVVAKPVPAGAG
jgi:hypothetical protein